MVAKQINTTTPHGESLVNPGKKKTLIMLSSQFPPGVGGVATFAYQISHRLADDGYPVVVMVPDAGASHADRKETSTNRVKLIDVPFYNGRIRKPWWYLVYPLFLLAYVLRAWSVVRNNRNSAILAAYWFPDGFVAHLVTRIWGGRYHVVVHGLDILRVFDNRRKRGRLFRVLSRADTVICRSGFTSELVEQIGIPLDRISKITDGIDPAEFYPSPEGESVRRRLGLEGRHVLFTLGRLVDRKGHSLVLRALPSILKEFPETMYVIGGDGPEKESLLQLSERLGVQDNVIFLGQVAPEELRAYYNACDIFVMPNHVGRNPWDVEGFGIVFLEAAACGKPVVGGASGGAPDAILDGETGFCVPENDVSAVEEKIALLLGDGELRTRMGDAARARVLKEFTWEHVAAIYALELCL